MKHKKGNRTLGRVTAQRRSLFVGLTDSLLQHGSIMTTEAKAKELRKHVEPLVRACHSDLNLAQRRQLLKVVSGKESLERLEKIGKHHADRPGGYLRVTKTGRRRSDDAPMARIDIIDFDSIL